MAHPKRPPAAPGSAPDKPASGWDVDAVVEVVQRHIALQPKVSRRLRADLRRTLAGMPAQTQRAVPAAAPLVPEGDEVLSTQQAADLIGVSRPFMAARIDAGDVPLFQQIGNQRRVLASSVLAWNERSREQRRAAIAELSRSIEDEYDED